MHRKPLIEAFLASYVCFGHSNFTFSCPQELIKLRIAKPSFLFTAFSFIRNKKAQTTKGGGFVWDNKRTFEFLSASVTWHSNRPKKINLLSGLEAALHKLYIFSSKCPWFKPRSQLDSFLTYVTYCSF